MVSSTWNVWGPGSSLGHIYLLVSSGFTDLLTITVIWRTVVYSGLHQIGVPLGAGPSVSEPQLQCQGTADTVPSGMLFLSPRVFGVQVWVVFLGGSGKQSF